MGNVSSTLRSTIPCARCGKEAKYRCPYCIDAPEYHEPIPYTYYCKDKCQTRDWKRHEPECKPLHERKKLERIAYLLQEIYYRIRIQAAPRLFETMQVEGSTIYLNGYRDLNNSTRKLLQPFPIPGDANKSEGEKQNYAAALSFMGCLETMVYLHGFVDALFSGDNYEVKEANAKVANANLKFIARYPTGRTVDIPVRYHNFYKVTYKNGETWAIDPSGAQFGFFNPLTPWHTYIASRTVDGSETFPLGEIQRNTYGSLVNQPMRVMVAQTMQNSWFIKFLIRKLPRMESKFAGNLANAVRGTDAAFEEQKKELLGMIDDGVKDIIDEMFSDECMKRMDDLIDRQLLNNRIDPESQNRMEEVMRFMKDRA